MRIQGIQCTPQKHLTWRHPRSGETDLSGLPFPSDHKIIVSKDADEPVPQLRRDRRSAYGRWRHQKNRKGKWITVKGEVVRAKEYWTAAVYFVVGDTIYRGSIKRITSPNAHNHE